MIPTPDTLLEHVLLAAVFVVASARITRLIVADTFPPSVKLRIWYEDHTSGGWESLVSCPWCFGFWAVTLNAGLGWAASALNGPIWTIWVALNGLLAASYAVSWIVFHDEDGA